MEGVTADREKYKVLNSLRRVHRARALTKLAEASSDSLSVLILTVLVSTLLEMSFNFGSLGRAILLLFWLGAVVFMSLRYLAPALAGYLRSPRTSDLVRAASEVGRGFPELRDGLRNAIELMSAGERNFHSEELARAYVAQIFQNAVSLDLESAVTYRTKRRPTLFLVASFAALLLLAAFFPSRSPSAFARVVDFTHEYSLPDAYSMEVQPGDTELSRGDTLRIRVSLSLVTTAHFPDHIVVSEKYRGEKNFEKHRIRGDPEGHYQFNLPNVRASVVYFISAGDQESRKFDVKVVDLPVVQRFNVRLTYPGYTGRAPETLQNNIGDFTALVGTRAAFSIRSNKSLRGAWIVFDNGKKERLETSGNEASGSFIIRQTRKYILRLVDSDSLRNRDPIAYTANAVSDEYPTCKITYPGKDGVLNRDMILPLRITIGDDYGFTKLLLQYKLVSSKYVPPEKEYHSIEIPLPSRSAGEQEISYLWDLTSSNLVPEDVISYHARVFDNDMVNGPKSTVSSEYTLRLPSLREVFASADSNRSDLVSKTEDALNSSDNLKEQLAKIGEELKTATKQMSWEQEKKMENTVQKYDSLRKKVEGIKDQIEKMTQNMLANKIISTQTLEKYQELQRALQQIDSPQFQEALKKLQQAIRSLNPQLVREAMKDFQINDEMLRKSIERTLSLIRRIQVEQKLDELQTRTEQMLTQQDNLTRQTSQADSASTSARRQLSENQRQISRELSSTKRAMSELKKMMNEFADEMPVKKLEKARTTLDRSGVGGKMMESGRQLAGGKFSDSRSTQRQISSALQNFRNQLSETQKSMLRNQERATVDALRKVQKNLLEISGEQEKLRDQSGRVIPNSAETRSLAERQNDLMQQLGYTTQQLMQLSNKSFAVTPQMGRQIGEAYGQMEQALSNLQSRNGSSPTGSQSLAMGAMNQAVVNIQGTLQSMMHGQGGSGFPSLMQQLQQLAGKQEGLNALTRQLAEQGALSMEQQAEIARLAARQEMVHKSLEQLARESEQPQARNRVLGDLNEIGKQMSDVIKDMRNRNITLETIRRQEKILSHLLDASRSIRERNYDNRRVAKAGKDVITVSPGRLNLSNAGSEREQELLKLIRENFPPEYQKIILRYYHLLQKSPE